MRKLLLSALLLLPLRLQANEGPLFPQGRHFIHEKSKRQDIIASYGNVVPTTNLAVYNIDAVIQEIVSYGASQVRLWHLLPWEDDPVNVPRPQWSEWPWMRVPGVDHVFDREQPNQNYWNRIRSTLQKLTSAGITSEIMFFDSSNIKKAYFHRTPFSAIANPDAEGHGFPDFYENLGIRETLRGFVRKMIEQTAEFNVVFEIENEHAGVHAEDREGNFIVDMARTAREKLAELAALPDPKFNGIRRAISYSYFNEADADNKLMTDINRNRASFFNHEKIDVINIHLENPNNPGRALEVLQEFRKDIVTLRENHRTADKPIVLDEFGNGLGSGEEGLGGKEAEAHLLQQTAWTALVSGAYFHIEDAHFAARPVELVRNVQAFIRQTGFQFYNTGLPEGHRKHVENNDMCLSQTSGLEKICYFPYGRGGTHTINFGPRSSYYFWWEPATNTFFEGESTRRQISGQYDVLPPNADPDRDWVLFIIDANELQTRLSAGKLPNVLPNPNPKPETTASSRL